MKKLINAFIHFQTQKTVLFIAVLVSLFCVGTYIALKSEIKAFPDLTNVQVQVITQYPGKAPEEVEREVTIPTEVAMNGLPGLVNQRSISIFGLSVVTLTFDDNVKSRQARVDVAQRFSDLDLPDGVKPGLSPDSTPIGEIYRYTLNGNVLPGELKLIQDWTLERVFKSIPGVADVVSFGGPNRVIEVRLDLPRIKALGLSVSMVAEALAKNSANAGGRLITHGDETYIVRSLGRFQKPEELENAVILTVKNTPIRVRDVGYVEIGQRPRLGQVGRLDSDDEIEGIILLRQGSNTLETCAQIKEKIKYLQESVLPKSVKITPFYDRTELIQRSSHTVFHNIVFGIGLVCLIMVLSFGLNYWPLILGVILIIPFALMMSFVGVKWLGFSPNLISLGAVDFGIIVETAIFSAEAVIASLRREKRKDTELISESLSEVFGPALMCALLLLIAFVPILSMQSVEGRIFKPLGITLVSALIGGQLGALIFIPTFSIFAPIQQIKPALLDPWFDRIEERCERIAKTLSQKKSLALISFLILGGIVFLLNANLKKEFLPQLNEGSIYIRATAPQTISIEQSIILAGDIRHKLKTVPEVIDVISQIGRPDDGTDVNGFDNIEFFVKLCPPHDWHTAKSIEGLIEAARKTLADIDGVDFNFSQPIKDNVDEAISGVKGELVFKIVGTDLKQLQKLANQASDIIKTIPGAKDVAPEQLLGQPELRFNINRDSLDRYGLKVTDTEEVLETALLGKFATKMMDPQGRFVDIIVKPDLKGKYNKETLANLPVLTPFGANIPLREVTTPKLVEGVARIYREQGLRRIAVKCSVDKSVSVMDFVQAANKKIQKEMSFPEKYQTSWSGSFENARRAAHTLMIVVPLCLVAMIIILYSWFNNWRHVALIFWQIPFGLLGGMGLLKMMGINLSVSAAAGGIVLIGVSFLSGIMLLNEWIHFKSIWPALKEKSQSIIVSNGVAIVGLIPAAFSHGIGSETARPFAVMILGGLITSLILTLTVFPALLAKEESR